jgi:uncharacterized protein YegL
MTDIEKSIDLSISQTINVSDTSFNMITVKNLLLNTSHKRYYLLLDNSGSMNGDRLNLVKHACKVIVSASNEDVEICIFIFSSICTQITELLPMNEDNKKNFIDIISTIGTNGSTDLIRGLNTIFEYIKNIPNPELIDTHCIILTDGEPDCKDINQYNKILDDFLSDSKINCIIDLFGFGNSLSIDIMKSIYTKGKGIFSFISDVNMLATIFNNYIANLLSVTIKNAILSYEIEDINKNTKIEYLYINDILSSQEKNFIIEIPNDSKITYAKLTYSNLNKNIQESLSFEEIPLIEIDETKFYLNKLRYELIYILLNISNDSLKIINDLYTKYSIILSNLLINENTLYYSDILVLLNDIKSTETNKGQIEKGIISYNSWGKYYLISICQSYINQTTINFKDESIQKFSGYFSKNILSKLDIIFNTIPYINNNFYSNYTQSQTQTQTPITASQYNDRYAGCFDGRCKVKTMRNNIIDYIQLKDLKHGDRLYSENSIIIVEFILKTKYINQELYKINNLVGTKQHPIYDNNWIYLSELNYSERLYNYDCDYLYTISAIEIFENGTFKNISYFKVENYCCATFGHGNLDVNHNDNNYSKLSSTFWGQTILFILYRLKNEKLITNNILELDINDRFIRDNNGLCIGLLFNGIHYY